MENLELRMYGLVPYNISPIQQGIQFGHAKDEYTLSMFEILDEKEKHDSESLKLVIVSHTHASCLLVTIACSVRVSTIHHATRITSRHAIVQCLGARMPKR